MSELFLPPPEVNTLHCIGDFHEDGTAVIAKRKAAVLDDLNNHPRMPGEMTHLQLGDFSNTAQPSQYALAIDWMNKLQGPWYAIVGNHDMYDPSNNTGTRSAELAAADMGMPSASYNVDLGYAMLICLGAISINSRAGTVLTYDAEYLNNQLVAYSDRTCLIAAHPPLHGTVGSGSTTEQWRSIDPGFFAYDDAALRTVLADNPNAKAWISGHTHSKLTDHYFVKREPVGGRTIAAINTSCLAYTGRVPMWYDRLATVYVTTWEDRIEVRFRDHGAHEWVGGSHDHRRVWTVPFD